MWIRASRNMRMASTGIAGFATAAVVANSLAARTAFSAAASKTAKDTSLAAAAAPIAPLGEVTGPLALETDL
jgi:hypothetical protein